MSEVWVPTAFHRSVFAASGVDPAKLVVVPEPVDTDFFDPLRHQPLPLPLDQRVFGPDWPHGGMADDEDGGPYGVAGDGAGDPFVWLSIFKWETRKVCPPCPASAPQRHRGAAALSPAYAGLGPPAAGLPDGLHRGGQRAADAAHAALPQRGQLCGADAGKLPGGRQLAGHPPSQPRFDQALRPLPPPVQAWARAELGDVAADPLRLPSVYVSSQHLARSEVPRLFKSADAFVLPTRGEGWGLPLAEAMAMSLPVVATNWSGPTAFLDSSVGYPLRVEGLAEVEEGAFKGERAGRQQGLSRGAACCRGAALHAANRASWVQGTAGRSPPENTWCSCCATWWPTGWRAWPRAGQRGTACRSATPRLWWPLLWPASCGE